MNITAEIKRICKLQSYLELLRQNEAAINCCKKCIKQGNELYECFDAEKFYKKRLLAQLELSEWLQNRYKTALSAEYIR